MDALLPSVPAYSKRERPIVPITKNTKEYRAGLAFLNGARMTRSDAWNLIGDSCLNTTVSTLQNKHGIRIDREWIDAPTRYGETTQIKRYWLAESSRTRLIESLGVGGSHGQEV
jgi:hypothetical protein